MSTRVFALLPTAALLCACSRTDPDAPLAGQWETRIELVSIDGKKPSAEERALASKGGAQRLCYDGAPPKVGDKTQGGRCTVVRAADSGPKVDREWQCERPANPGKVTTRFTGARAPERYEFTITTVDQDAAGKPNGLSIVVRETGRRVGECSEK